LRDHTVLASEQSKPAVEVKSRERESADYSPIRARTLGCARRNATIMSSATATATATAARAITITDQDARRLVDLVSIYAEKEPAAVLLDDELGRARVVAARDVEATIVTMRSRVVCRDAAGEMREIELVYPRDADISAGRISVLAPLGRALLGASVGDQVSVAAGRKITRWIVESVRYQPEAAGDFHR